MHTIQTKSTLIIWLAVGLAFLTALTYLLIAANLLGVGDPNVARDGGAIVYVAAGCYLLGGLLILLRNRWLLILGGYINVLVIFSFFNMYQGRPEVLFSPGGLLSKSAQILLEIALLLTLVVSWKKAN